MIPIFKRKLYIAKEANKRINFLLKSSSTKYKSILQYSKELNNLYIRELSRTLNFAVLSEKRIKHEAKSKSRKTKSK